MKQDHQVRKLPKKTIYLIVALVLLGILAILAVSASQQATMAGILKKLGHPNISKITIYNKSPVTDEVTQMRGELSKIRFYDNDTQQECFGFVLKNKKTGEYTKDLDCK